MSKDTGGGHGGPPTPALAHLDIDKLGFAWVPENDFVHHFPDEVTQLIETGPRPSSPQVNRFEHNVPPNIRYNCPQRIAARG
jgi:hypothetical protein